ncbi:ABC transporter substrate-binding protein [Paenibacillus sp. 2TAB23]|uniref:ABC transporter substrate-binding protein n=1 Tax=Paenibacillus sp. 2TAB23 TaxID=3233004 RepID=UPI003F962E60
MMLIVLAALFAWTITACSTGTGNHGENGVTVGNGNIGNTGKGEEQPAGGDKPGTSSGQQGGLGRPSTTEKKTVVFSTFFPSNYFKEAKKRYEAQHPNITIDLQYIDSDNAHLEENLEKFVKTTGTAMLSGKGPDLIEMDQLPSDDYVKKKMLANLGEIIDRDPDFKKEQYFTNVLNGMQVNGGMYGLPVGFFIYGLIGNEDAIKKSGVPFDDSKWNWDQFIVTAQEMTKGMDKDHQYALGGSMPEYMTTQFVNERFATFINQEQGKASFESSSFTDLLKQVKVLFDEKVVGTEARFPLFRTVQINSPADYIRELRQSEFISGGNAYVSKLYSSPSTDQQHPGGSFRTYQTIGLNERSAVKPEAWDFLKFLLSDEMQAKQSGAGFPLNKAAYAKQAKGIVEKGSVESDQPIGPMKGKSFEIKQQDINDLEKFLNGATYPLQFKPSQIDEIIVEEAQAFFTGQKSAEDVAKLIQNRVTTYLNE